jgi:hypothetical protein
MFVTGLDIAYNTLRRGFFAHPNTAVDILSHKIIVYLIGAGNFTIIADPALPLASAKDELDKRLVYPYIVLYAVSLCPFNKA